MLNGFNQGSDTGVDGFEVSFLGFRQSVVQWHNSKGAEVGIWRPA